MPCCPTKGSEYLTGGLTERERPRTSICGRADALMWARQWGIRRRSAEQSSFQVRSGHALRLCNIGEDGRDGSDAERSAAPLTAKGTTLSDDAYATWLEEHTWSFSRVRARDRDRTDTRGLVAPATGSGQLAPWDIE